MENDVHKNLEFLDCIDMLGVTDHAYVNETELSVEKIEGSTPYPLFTDSRQSIRVSGKRAHHGSVDRRDSVSPVVCS